MDLTGVAEKIRNRGGYKTIYYVDSGGSIIAKQCRKCGEVKKMEGFPRDKSKLGGRRSECRECMNERDRQFRVDNRERLNEYHRQHYADNRDQYYLRGERRRARLRKIPDTLTSEQRDLIIARFDGGCALTGDKADVHLDHVIPITIGHGGTIFENIIPLRADLNLSKGTGNIFDWFESNRQRLKLDRMKFNALIEYLADINGMTTKEYENYVRECHENPRQLDGGVAN